MIFFSCKGQSDKFCEKDFTYVRSLVQRNQNNTDSLNYALTLTDKLLDCRKIYKSVIDFKIALLISLKSYDEGAMFVSKLNDEDFSYKYKRNLIEKNFKALKYEFLRDTANQKLTYRSMSQDIEKYIISNDIRNMEFEEAFIDLFTIQEKFLNTNQINTQVDSLKKKYPDKQSFFNFFYK